MRIFLEKPTKYTMLMGDFNAKLGIRENGELKVGKFGIGQWNPRGQQLADEGCVIQVYAPTSAHPDEEVEEMYENISRAMHSYKIYTVLMGDFNAKLGTRENCELKVGKFGIGQRNPKGQQLTDFIEKEGLFMMNSFSRSGPTESGPD